MPRIPDADIVGARALPGNYTGSVIMLSSELGLARVKPDVLGWSILVSLMMFPSIKLNDRVEFTVGHGGVTQLRRMG